MPITGNNGGTMRKQLEAVTIASLAIVGMVGLSSTVACSQAAGVRAMMSFKQANQAYQHQEYKRAAALYEDTIQADPSLAQVYFYLGNSYDNLYKPGDTSPANTELLTKALQNYQAAAEKLSSDKPEEAKLKALDLQYLVAIYGPDKLDDPVKAEPVIQRLIQLDPTEPANYFNLAKIYEDAGMYPEAEDILMRAKQAKPGEPTVYMQLAGYYNRQGDFEKTIEALQERTQREANNPEAFYTIATYYWDEAYRDARLSENDKKGYVEKGLDAIDTSLRSNPTTWKPSCTRTCCSGSRRTWRRIPPSSRRSSSRPTRFATRRTSCASRRPRALAISGRFCRFYGSVDFLSLLFGRSTDSPSAWIKRPPDDVPAAFFVSRSQHRVKLRALQ